MVVVMDGQTSDADVEKLADKLESLGFDIQTIRGERRIVLAIIGDTKNLDSFPFYAYSGVKEVLQVAKPYKLASREFKGTSTTIRRKEVVIGGKELIVMAGPCAVESEEQIFKIAHKISKLGI